VTVSGFDRLLSGNATNYRRNNTRLDGAYKMGRGKIDNPNVTFPASDEDWVSMSNKTLKVPWAYLTGRLKIQGSQSLVKKLEKIFP
jgi:putative sterol carrier protein